MVSIEDSDDDLEEDEGEVGPTNSYSDWQFISTFSGDPVHKGPMDLGEPGRPGRACTLMNELDAWTRFFPVD